MAKKTTKKNTKSATNKKVAKKVEQTIIETPNDEMEAALDEIEDGTKEIEQEEDAVFGEEEDFVNQDQPMIETISEPSYTPTEKEINQAIEVLNGDPSVVLPIDKIEEEAMAETFKENKPRKMNGDPFTYSWNGQEIDYIL